MTIIPMTRRLLVLSALLLFPLLHAAAQSPPQWEDVTERDWAVTPDSAKGISEAAMVFERVVSDETDDDSFLLRVYRRVRILSAKGREWGDVSIQYNPSRTEFTVIAGRTILRDGTIIPLDPKAIAERTPVKTENFEVKEKFFSLPGVTQDCLIEYWYEKQNEFTNSVWVPQKDIPLLEWEYRWKFSEPEVAFSRSGFQKELELRGVPNYVVVNFPFPAKITQLPDEKKPDTFLFQASNMPAFVSEPFMPPDEAVRANVRFTYGGTENWEKYWNRMAERATEWLEYLDSFEGDAGDVAERFATLPGRRQQVDSVFAWIQKNFRNTGYDGSVKDPEPNRCINDILDHQYGDDFEICAAYVAILRHLGITAQVFAVPNRAERKFFAQAKYWQFDGYVVAVRDSSFGTIFEAPSEPGTAPRRLPWFYEGVPALVVKPNIGDKLFGATPSSPALENATLYDISVELRVEEPTRYTVESILTGEEARHLRALLKFKAESERLHALREDIASDLAEGWKDSVSVSSFAESGDSVTVRYRLVGPPLEPSADGRVIFRPFAYLARAESPFVSPVRKHPIDLRFMDVRTWRISIALPDAMSAEALPDPIRFKNGCGSIDMITSSEGNLVSVQARRQFRQSVFDPSLHFVVGEMFDYKAKLMNTSLVLKGTP
jgi:hypothetical protein